MREGDVAEREDARACEVWFGVRKFVKSGWIATWFFNGLRGASAKMSHQIKATACSLAATLAFLELDYRAHSGVLIEPICGLFGSVGEVDAVGAQAAIIGHGLVLGYEFGRDVAERHICHEDMHPAFGAPSELE